MLDGIDWDRGPRTNRRVAGESALYVDPKVIPSEAHVAALAAAAVVTRAPEHKHGRAFTPAPHCGLLVYRPPTRALGRANSSPWSGRTTTPTAGCCGSTGRCSRSSAPAATRSCRRSGTRGARSSWHAPPVRTATRWPVQLAARSAEVGPDGLLFPAPRGGYWAASNMLRRVFVPARRTAEWDEAWTWHGLRHHAATWMLGAGLQPEHVSVQMGHRSVRTTLDMYIGQTADTLAQIRQVI